MSKASEWAAAMNAGYMARIDPPRVNLSDGRRWAVLVTINEEEPYVSVRDTGFMEKLADGREPYEKYRESVLLSRDEAFALARWILDTFGDPTP